jgi:hypothetical protein
MNSVGGDRLARRMDGPAVRPYQLMEKFYEQTGAGRRIG